MFATQRQNELFDALVDVLLSEGFAHLTLDDIAARLHCSKSTLYALADSKEQLVRAATIHFFRRAAADVESRLDGVRGARDRITSYLSAVGKALAPVSRQFMNDLGAFAPARQVYEDNTRIAADRVHDLIADGVASGEFRQVNAAFAADMIATMMVRIQQGGLRATVGVDDAVAYSELASILTSGMSA